MQSECRNVAQSSSCFVGSDHLHPDDSKRQDRSGPRHALLYCRTARTDPDDTNVAKQIAGLIAYCDGTGLAYDLDQNLIVNRNCSGISLRSLAAAHTVLEAAAERGIEHIVVENLDRISRNADHNLLFLVMAEHHDLKVHLAGKGSCIDGKRGRSWRDLFPS